MGRDKIAFLQFSWKIQRLNVLPQWNTSCMMYKTCEKLEKKKVFCHLEKNFVADFEQITSK